MHKEPLVIGGSGGSGTRLVCQFFQHLGYNMGSDLNEALDNLLFTFLLKRPGYFKDLHDPKITSAIILFNKATNGSLNLLDRLRLYLAYKNNNHAIDANEMHFKRARYKKALGAKPKDKPWGWKEPNNQLFIQHIHSYYRDVKYIHVIRNGYYMCQSSNQQQLRNWGDWFGIQPTSTSLIDQAKFWIAINSNTIKYCQEHLRNQFLIVNYDDLLLESDKIKREIYAFIGRRNEGVESFKLDFKLDMVKYHVQIENIKSKLPQEICNQIDDINQVKSN